MERLHSDGANNVNGEVMQQISKLLGVDKSKSSRLHPEGDGLSEAVVKIVKSVIQKHVDYFGSNWDLYLQSAAFAMRSNISSGTGVSPAELILGESLKHPIDIEINTKEENVPLNVKQARNFASKLKGRLNESSAIVNDSLRKTRGQMKRSYDKSVTKHDFKVVDNVMISDPPQRKASST